jgi:hypothetical protein
MLFLEALAQLKAGDAMRRTAWPDCEGYLKVLPDMDYVWKIVTRPTPNAGNFIFSIKDFESDDWVKYEVPVAPVAAIEEEKEAAA